MKVKIINDFTISKETINAKAFEKNENNVQLILHRCIINKFFEILIKINKIKTSQIHDNDTSNLQ